MSSQLTAAQTLELDRLERLGHSSTQTALIGFVLSAIGVAVLWSTQHHDYLLIWLGLQGLLTWWRVGTVWRRFRVLRATQPLAALDLKGMLRAGCLLSGLVWGLLGFARFDEHLPQVPVFITFMLAGAMAGGATAMSIDLVSALGYLALIVLPLELHMLAYEVAPVYRAMGLTGLLYIGFLGLWTRRMNIDQVRDLEARSAAAERERALAEREARYRQLAHHDVLTSLPNRLSLQAELPALLERAAAREQRVAAVYLDLDHFKDINDSRGHRFGDLLLETVGRRLRACVRPEDLVVRMGGDEFIVVATEVQERAQLDQLARRLAQAISEPAHIEGDSLVPRASFGLAIYPDDGADAESLLRHADMALYHAKSIGRNTHQFFAEDMRIAFTERIFLQESLARALDGDQLFLEFQPLVDLQGGHMLGLEALLRWRHPERGLIPPMNFIPVAEHSGLINALGERVLRLLCRQIADWQRASVPVLPVSVNVSPWQFEHGRVATVLAAAARESGIDPGLLQVEITETALITDAGNERQTIDELRRLGLQVVIDDFGIGYSSLSHLKHLAIDGLKIDRSFVIGMVGDARDAAIVRATIAIGESLEIAVLAEGVESERHLHLLLELGCRIGQGHFLHGAVGADEARALLLRAAAGAPLPGLAAALARRRPATPQLVTSNIA